MPFRGKHSSGGPSSFWLALFCSSFYLLNDVSSLNGATSKKNQLAAQRTVHQLENHHVWHKNWIYEHVKDQFIVPVKWRRRATERCQTKWWWEAVTAVECLRSGTSFIICITLELFTLHWWFLGNRIRIDCYQYCDPISGLEEHPKYVFEFIERPSIDNTFGFFRQMFATGNFLFLRM